MSTAPALTAVPATNIKRKQRDGEDSDDDDSGSDVSMINVDFDFYNPNPEVDDIALKRLLNQLFSTDSLLFNIHDIATLFLSAAREAGVGSCVKVDGEESDPYAVLGVLDLVKYASNPAITPLINYLISTIPNPTTPSPLRTLLTSTLSPPTPTSPKVALVFSERLINLPVQLVPPMWGFMMDEIEAAQKEGKGMEFTHYLLVSRVYEMQAGNEDDGMQLDEDLSQKQPASKKSKKSKPAPQGLPFAAGTFYYHPEEEFLEKVALHTHTYPFRSAQPRDSESFGVDQKGRILVIEAGRVREGLKLMKEAVC